MFEAAEKQLETIEKMSIQYSLEDNEEFFTEFQGNKQRTKCEINITKDGY